MSALFGDCGAYRSRGRVGCSMIGSEYCDWSCPRGGIDGVIAETATHKRAMSRASFRQGELELNGAAVGERTE